MDIGHEFTWMLSKVDYPVILVEWNLQGFWTNFVSKGILQTCRFLKCNYLFRKMSLLFHHLRFIARHSLSNCLTWKVLSGPTAILGGFEGCYLCRDLFQDPFLMLQKYIESIGSRITEYVSTSATFKLSRLQLPKAQTSCHGWDKLI